MEEVYLKVRTAAKEQRWKLRRLAVQRKYGREIFHSAPVLFANAIPKAGSHLLSQIIRGMCDLGPFVDSGGSAVTRNEAGHNLPENEVVGKIQKLLPGDIGYGKVPCKPPFNEALTRPEMATIFIYRDPRDLAISRVRYATEMHNKHHLHDYFTRVLRADEERLRFIIAGSEAPSFSYEGLRTRFLNYIGWLDQPVLSLRFEDFVSGNLRESLGQILDFVAEKGYTPSVSREEAITTLEKAIRPSKSGTFRVGTSGQWKTVYSQAMKDLFKEMMGDLLIQYGYEQDYDW